MTKWWNHRTAAFLMLTMALGACSGDPSSPDATRQAAAPSASSERADTSWDASPENDLGGADSPLLASPDANSRHYALVFGNSQYRHGDALPAASKDAALMASALRGRGYHVLLARDRTLAQMREDIDAFSDLSARADVRVIYFAGHGFEFGHDNYLMPVDLPSAIHELDETLIRQSALRLQDVAWPLEQEQGVLIAIVDACRVGPSRGAAAAKALGAATPPQGTILAYATAPGTTAADSLRAYGVDADHSPYAYFLASALSDPGVERWDEALLSTASIVRFQTRGVQTPWMNATVNTFPPLGGRSPSDPAATGTGAAAPLQGINPERRAANRYWSEVELQVALKAQDRLIFDDELETASNAGDEESALVLAYRWSERPGYETRAIALLEPLAEKGNAVAQLTLGTLLHRLPARDSRGRKATHWWHKASANGMGEARAKLAMAEGRADMDSLHEFAAGVFELYDSHQPKERQNRNPESVEE